MHTLEKKLFDYLATCFPREDGDYGKKGETPYATWLGNIHEKGRQAFHHQKIPTQKKKEAYHYTPLMGYLNKLFGDTPPQQVAGAPPIQKEMEWEALPGHHFSLQNGVLTPPKSIPTALHIASFEEAYTHSAARLTAYVGNYATGTHDPFIALNTSFFQNGVWLHIPKNVHIQKPIFLHHHIAHTTSKLIQPRLLLTLGENSRATIIETIPTPPHTPSLLNRVAEIVLHDNARLTHYLLQNRTSSLHPQLHHTFVQQASHTTLKQYTATSSLGGMVRNHLCTQLMGEKK